MISAGDFRNGITFELDGNVYRLSNSSTLSRVRVPLSSAPSIRMLSLAQW